MELTIGDYVIDDKLYCSETIICGDEMFVACSKTIGVFESDFFLYNVSGYWTSDDVK